MVGVCSRVISHLATVAHGNTWGRVKAQFGTGAAGTLINRRFLCSAAHSQRTVNRTTRSYEDFQQRQWIKCLFWRQCCPAVRLVETVDGKEEQNCHIQGETRRVLEVLKILHMHCSAVGIV